MNTIGPPSAEMAQHRTAPRSDDLDLRQILLTVWRHKALIVGITAVITVLSYVYIQSLTPRYTAEAVLVLDTRKANVGIDPVVAELRQDETVIRSEVDVLRSRWLARRVADELGLTNDPEFNPALRPRKPGLIERLAANPWVPEPLRAWLGDPGATASMADGASAGPVAAFMTRLAESAWLPDVLRERLTPAPAPPEGFEASETGETRTASSSAEPVVIDTILSNLTAVNDGRSYTVRLHFRSKDPDKAARIVDAFAGLYLAGQRESKYEAAERGAAWLEKKIGQLRERVRATETDVLEYRKTHSLLSFGRDGTLLNKRMAKVGDELIAAKNERLRAENRLQEFQWVAATARRGAPLPAIAGWPELQRLVEKIRATEATLTELRSTYGENHPRIKEPRAHLARLNDQLQEEIDRILAGLESDVRLAAKQETSFANMLDELEAENLEAHRDQVELRQLESEAQAARQLRDTFLTNLDRTSVQLDLVQPDARVLSHAEPPQWPSYPPKRILLALSLLGSLMVGFAVVFILEFLHKGFRSTEQIERACGVPVLGMVPLVKSRGVGRHHPSAYALQNPFSTFTESVRLIRSAIRRAAPENQTRVVLVTSAVPGEGKTALALTLGRLSAAADQKVLLIDCDLRAPSVATDLGTSCQEGLAEVLAGDATIKDVVRVDEASGLHFIPAGGRSFQGIELLTSERMEKLIAAARKVSDTIILDSPPVTLVSDPLVLSGMADTTLMVVRWDRTPRSLVVSAMKKLAGVRASSTGVVLSQVNLARHASYGFGDFPHGYLPSYQTSG